MKQSRRNFKGDTWSQIGDSHYSVSSSGQVRNNKTNKIKATRLNRYGYPVVDIYKDGVRSSKRVHRLVAESFVPNLENKPQVNHIDGNKLNNNSNNLEWTTAKENMAHASRLDLVSHKPHYGMLGKKNPNAGRHGLAVRVIETGKEYKSIKECSEDINGSDRGICEVLKGRQQTHKGFHYEYI